MHYHDHVIMLLSYRLVQGECMLYSVLTCTPCAVQRTRHGEILVLDGTHSAVATTRNEDGLNINRISGPLAQWFLPGEHQNCRNTRGWSCHRSVTGARAAATGGCSLWMLHHLKPPMSQPVARGPITGVRSPASSRWLLLF